MDTSIKEDSLKVYSASEVDLKLKDKADKATTLAGYGITDAYTKDVINAAVASAKKAGDDAADALSKYKTSNDAAVAEAKKAGNDATSKVLDEINNRKESYNKLDKRIVAIENLIDENGDINLPTCTPITHSELKSLCDNKTLVSGAFYRITDYECTTTQADTQSANHPFDIIVQALDEHTLSENAQAIQHEGDEYFANAKLESWQLKYTIDNDTTRFSWAHKEIVEQPAQWSCERGVLEEKNNSESSTNYEPATIEDKEMYLYRPLQPTTFLENKRFYYKTYVGYIEDTDGFTYEADNAPYNDGDKDDPDWAWDDVTEIRVISANGNIVAVLTNDERGYFYDEEYDE